MGSLSTEQAQIDSYTCLISYYELRLVNLSSTKDIKSFEGSAKVGMYSQQMSAELDAIKAKLGDDPTSQEYRQNMSECESCENKYGAIIQQITDQMEIVEERLDGQIEQTNTLIEAARAESEKWKEARDNTTDNFAPNW